LLVRGASNSLPVCGNACEKVEKSLTRKARIFRGFRPFRAFCVKPCRGRTTLKRGFLYRIFSKLDADECGFMRKNQLKIRVFSVYPHPKMVLYGSKVPLTFIALVVAVVRSVRSNRARLN
jgi:hypothetical protein